MIEAFQKFAANAPDFPVYAEFDGHERETLDGATCLGWFRDEEEAEAVAERARAALGCRKAIVVPKRYLLPAFVETILLFDRLHRGEVFDLHAANKAILEKHGCWPASLSLVLIEPVVEAAREKRVQQWLKQKAKAKYRRRRLAPPQTNDYHHANMPGPLREGIPTC